MLIAFKNNTAEICFISYKCCVNSFRYVINILSMDFSSDRKLYKF